MALPVFAAEYGSHPLTSGQTALESVNPPGGSVSVFEPQKIAPTPAELVPAWLGLRPEARIL
jgi:hypothetical protein